ncbi:MAG: thermonuclease family protein [Thermogutta sp.]|nr:thermonuclease family protein [Thermogutta sp.]
MASRRRTVRRPIAVLLPRSRRRWSPGALILVALVLLLLRLLHRGEEPFPSGPSEPLQSGEYVVERVVDGDTLLLAGGERVRLLGIDAPESVKPNSPVEPFGPEASQAVRDLLSGAGNRIRLETENKRDKYGRLLGVVWAGEICVNQALVEAGLARVERQYSIPESLKVRLLAAEIQARAARRGIWGLERSTTP